MAICFLAIAVAILSFYPFRILSTTLTNDSVATTTPYIDIHFSQPLASVDEIKLTQNTESRSLTHTINDRTLRVLIYENLKENSSYTLTLNGIKSKWMGAVLSKQTITFVARYLAPNQLPEDQQKELVQRSNSGQVDDTFLNNQFPLAQDGYYIDLYNGGSPDAIYLKLVILKEVYNPDTGMRAQVSNQEAEEYRNKALKLVKEHGGDPKKYKFTYSNDYLEQKYASSSE